MSAPAVPVSGWLGRMVWGRHPRRTLIRALALGLLAYGVFSGPVRPIRLVGDSMEPTLRDGELRWANLWAFKGRDPRPGEIVLVRLHPGGRLLFVKRVLAAPGERIRFHQGRLMINGAAVEEPYVVHAEPWTTREYLLEPDEFYVCGDNRAQPMRAHATFIASRSSIFGALWSPRGAERSPP